MAFTLNDANSNNRCWVAWTTVTDSWITVVRCVQLAMTSATFCLLYALCRHYMLRPFDRMPMHRNLRILIVNVLFMYALYNLALFAMASRSLGLFVFDRFVPMDWAVDSTVNGSNLLPSAPPSSSACPFLVPVWMSILFRVPTYQHMFIYPLFHFAIMVERARATLRARSYEHEGTRFGTAACIIIWTLCALFTVWMVLSTLADDDEFAHAQAEYTMISRYNRNVVVQLSYVLLALVVLVALADIAIMAKNRRMVKMKRLYSNRSTISVISQNAEPIYHSCCTSSTTSFNSDAARYNAGAAVVDHVQHQQQQLFSLSRGYQLNENIASLQLFLPLDVTFALIFSLYLCISAHLRTNYNARTNEATFSTLYELNSCLLALHTLITLFFYRRFLCRRRPRRRALNIVTAAEDQRRLYMNELRTQWNAEK